LQVDLKDSLEKTHIRTLVQTDLVFPNVHHQDLAGGKGEKRALSFEVLILPSFTTIGAFHVHDKDIVGHTSCCRFVLGHPYAFGGLPPFTFRHNIETRSKESI